MGTHSSYVRTLEHNYRAGENIGGFGKSTIILPMFYLSTFSLPVIYSIGAYFDNIACELLMLSCYI